MKKILLFVFALGTLAANAQTFVSTAPENKNIILEEFTGITCVWCPAGHLIGQTLHDNNPNDVFLINIHTGGYATPQGAGTDFNTSFGDAIALQSNLAGYPAGTVNRHQFTMTQGGGTAMSRSDWSAASTQLLSQPSPVNVGIQASIDMATSTLTVDVEVYYTGTQFFLTSNMLNIAVVQNNIEGPQTGGQSNNPGSMLPNGNYNHNHMLRHMLTGQWGEQISNIAPGTLYSNTYTWTIPSQISGYPLSPTLDPTNIAIVAFVSEGQQEILSGTEVYPSVVFVNSYDAYCMSSSATDIVCAPTTDLEVTFRNYGNIPLTSLDITYDINGGAPITYPWTGNLASAGTETVTIPNVSLTPMITNTVNFSLTNPNGNADQNPSNNNSSATFAGLGSANPGNATIDITTDNYGDEITWVLEENGMVIAQGGPYQGGSSIVVPTAYATLTAGECYSFIIYDSYGDGILAPGGYTVKDGAGNIIASGGSNYTTEDQTNFESSGAAAASWDCDGQGNCSDPGTGAGFYTSLSLCNAACVVASYDCDGQGNCSDPGTGQGIYSTYNACAAACVTTAINEDISSLSVYPNPVKDILTINGMYSSVEIYDIYGKLVLSSDAKQTINVSSLSDGVYFININTNNVITVNKITIAK